MQPQGTAPVNLAVFEGIKQRIEGCGSCEQLQEVAADAVESMGAVIGGITDQIAAFEPLLALLTAPSADPSKIVEWITSFITDYLTAQFKPLLVYPAQLATLSAQLAELPALIAAKQAEFASCAVPLPPLPPIPDVPPLPPIPGVPPLGP